MNEYTILSEYREYSLQDVITQLEPDLFKKVTGLEVRDFELRVSLNVFNEALMNDAVYKFKRYEDASLIYTGIDKHTGENVGLYSTVISRADYDAMAGQVKGIDGGILIVVFDGVDKKLQFSGAFEQGFLKLDKE